MDPGELIRRARQAAGLTQRELAGRAGVTRTALSHYERGRRMPTVATLRVVLAAAGLQVRAELEQLDADVERAIAAVAAQPVADRGGVFGWGQIDRIAEVAHRVEGLAAASVFGAPKPVATFELALADEDSTFCTRSTPPIPRSAGRSRSCAGTRNVTPARCRPASVIRDRATSSCTRVAPGRVMAIHMGPTGWVGGGHVPADRRSAAGVVLLTLASGQFLMTLDSSVMNVSIAQVAADVGTTVTGIQTAITLYTLVMATLMITGGKIGSLIGRRRAFAIGCVIYGAGSLTTALAPNLTVLIIGWSFLEGVGAALIMPAIVALVASNFPPEGRPRAYGLVASAGAIAVAAGPLIGGVVTTYLTWRLVFAGEVVIVLGILALARRMQDVPPEGRFRLDLVGVALSATGLGLAVYGVLRSGEWGWVQPKPEGPSWWGVSPALWLILAGMLTVWLFFAWEERVVAAGREPLVRTSMLRNARLDGGLTMFSFQFMIQAGLFFTVPLFLSVALGLTAVETGVRLLPLSITLLLAAVGVPRFFPRVSPRRIVRWALGALLAGIVSLIAALEVGTGPEVVTVPLLLAGLGVGALASQLGAVTVSAVPDEQSGEVGGLQNTMTNLGASLGTALAGSILIAGLTTAFIQGIQENPAVPTEVASAAEVELASGIPFVSDADLEAALDEADVPSAGAQAILDENDAARIHGLRASLSVLAVVAIIALYFTRLIPTEPVGGPQRTSARAAGRAA
jgi:MFS family permease/transcriptional regulator with XRE-family HTH domain